MQEMQEVTDLNALFELETVKSRFDAMGVKSQIIIGLKKRRGGRPKELKNYSRRPFSDVAIIHQAAQEGRIKSVIFALDNRKQYGKIINVKIIYFSEKLSLDSLKTAVYG